MAGCAAEGPDADNNRLLAWVGMMVVMSSSESFLRIVVLPALSSPSTRMRACSSRFCTIRRCPACWLRKLLGMCQNLVQLCWHAHLALALA